MICSLILVWPHTYIPLGLEKEARYEAAEVLRINPKFSLENHVKSFSFKDRSAAIGILKGFARQG